ncbi:MAG: hypothetical protein DWH99_14190 [Planctomycetota bacterium]|nr:MAG: hypothetical protein DWH99_14190 [Planctomycetota bacterium]
MVEVVGSNPAGPISENPWVPCESKGFFVSLSLVASLRLSRPGVFARRVRGAVRIGVFGTSVPSTTTVTQHGLTNEKDRGTYHGSIDVVDCAKVRRGFLSLVDIGLPRA